MGNNVLDDGFRLDALPSDWGSGSLQKPRDGVAWPSDIRPDDYTPQSRSSAAGAFGRGAVRSAIPTVGGIGGMVAGAEGGAMVAPFLGPLAPAGPIVGGLAGMLGGSWLASKGQDTALRAMPDVAEAIGQSPDQIQADQENHPVASFLGELAPQALAFRPSLGTLKAAAGLGEATTGARWAARGQIAMGAALQGGMDAGQQYLNTGQIDPTQVALSAGAGALFHKPTAIGRGIENGVRGLFRRAPGEPVNLMADPEDDGSATPLSPGMPILSGPSDMLRLPAPAPSQPPVQAELFRPVDLGTPPDVRAPDLRGAAINLPDASAAPQTDVATQPDMLDQTPSATSNQDFGRSHLVMRLRAANPDAEGFSAPADSYTLKLAQNVSEAINVGRPDMALDVIGKAEELLQSAKLKGPTIDFRQNMLTAARDAVNDYVGRRATAQAVEGLQRQQAAPVNTLSPEQRAAETAQSIAAVRARNEQMAAAEAQHSLDTGVAQANKVVEDARARETGQKRAALLQRVLDDTTTINPLNRFIAHLKRGKFDPQPSADEMSTLIKFENARDAFTGQGEPAVPTETTPTEPAPAETAAPTGPASAPAEAEPVAQAPVVDAPQRDGAVDSAVPEPADKPPMQVTEEQHRKATAGASVGDLAMISRALPKEAFGSMLRDLEAAARGDGKAALAEKFSAVRKAAEAGENVDKRVTELRNKPEARTFIREEAPAALEALRDSVTTELTHEDIGRRLETAIENRGMAAEDYQRLRMLNEQRNVKPAALDKMVDAALGKQAREDFRDPHASPKSPGKKESTEAPRVSGMVRGQYGLSKILTHIAERSGIADNRLLAERLRRIIRDEVKVSTFDDAVGGLRAMKADADGAYDPASGTIAVNPDAANVESVVLHEAVHAATDDAISNGTPAGREIEGIYESYKAHGTQQVADGRLAPDALNAYGLRKDAHEFAAEALTEPAFQETLRQIRDNATRGRSLWDRFVNAISRVLGLPPRGTVAKFLDQAARLDGAVNRAAAEGYAVRRGLAETSGGVHLAAKDRFEAFADPRETLKRKAEDVAVVVPDSFRKLQLKVMAMRQIADRWKAKLPDLPRFVDLHALQDGKKTDYVASAARPFEQWTRLAPDQTKLLNDLLLDSTHQDIDPATDQGEIGKRFKQLSPEARAVFDGVRGTFAEQRTNYERIAREQIERSDVLTADEKSEALKDLKVRMAALNRRGQNYFPLHRFGDYLVISQTPEFEQAVDELSTAKAAVDSVRKKGTPDELQMVLDHQKQAEERLDSLRDEHFERASFENAADQLRHVKEMEAQGFNVRTDMVQKYNSAVDGVAPKFVSALDRHFEEEAKRFPEAKPAIDGLRSMAHQLAMAMAPEGSSLVKGYRRRGVAGFSRDALRVYAAVSQQAASNLSSLEFGPQIRETLENIRKTAKGSNELTEVYQQLAANYNKIGLEAKKTWEDRVASVTYAYALAASPSFAVMQAMQGPMVSAPMMAAREGFGPVMAAMAKAAKDVLSDPKAFFDKDAKAENFGKTPAEKAMLRYMDTRSEFANTYSGGFRAAARGQSKLGEMGRTIMDWATAVPHHTERFNRYYTALAAFRRAAANPKITQEFMPSDARWQQVRADNPGMFSDTPAAKRRFAATAYAEKITLDSHIDYSGWNSAHVFQRGAVPLNRLMLQFQKYPQAMLYHLISNAKDAIMAESPEVRKIAARTLGGVLGGQAVICGALGLPLAGAAFTFANWAHQMFGDDSVPFDAEVSFHNALQDAIGKDAADVATRGILYMPGVRDVMPLDVTKRLGLGDIMLSPDHFTDTDRKSFGAYMFQTLGGPAASLAMQMYSAGDYHANGQDGRAVEALVPKVMRDVLRTMRFAQEGVTAANGAPVLPADQLSSLDLAAQAIGFTPQKVQEAQTNRSAILGAQKDLAADKQALLKRYVAASSGGDSDQLAEVEQQIADFNSKMRERGLYSQVLAGRSLGRAVRARSAQGEQLDDGISLNRRSRSMRQFGTEPTDEH